MRLRAGHVVFALIALVTAFMVVVTTRVPSGDPASDAGVDATLPPAGSAPDERAVLEIDREMDFGIISRAEPAHRTLPVCNRGKRPLVIRDIQTSCACTRGELPPGKNIIPPGGCADVRVTVFPNRIFGFKSVKTLTFMSNDPVNPSVTVDVAATVDPEFSLEPETLDFGTVEKGTETRRTLRLATLTEEPVTVTAAGDRMPDAAETAPPGPWRHEIEKVPEADWKVPGKPEWLIHVTLEDWAAPGSLESAVFLSTDVKRFPHFRVPVTGEVRAPYTLTPDIPGGVLLLPAGQFAVLAVRAEAPLSCAGTGEVAGLTAAVQPDGDGRGFQLTVSGSPDSPPGRHEETLRVDIQTGEKTFQERLRVRWFGAARPPGDTPEPGPPGPATGE
ncbi:MAG: DUF1573 domain-containing protein [Candidatus Hydrogenedentes bacterium]|nr:DUF1573 domain-containing protein [Candidatus Hydrogenedentota bacterium]